MYSKYHLKKMSEKKHVVLSRLYSQVIIINDLLLNNIIKVVFTPSFSTLLMFLLIFICLWKHPVQALGGECSTILPSEHHISLGPCQQDNFGDGGSCFIHCQGKPCVTECGRNGTCAPDPPGEGFIAVGTCSESSCSCWAEENLTDDNSTGL